MRQPAFSIGDWTGDIGARMSLAGRPCFHAGVAAAATKWLCMEVLDRCTCIGWSACIVASFPYMAVMDFLQLPGLRTPIPGVNVRIGTWRGLRIRRAAIALRLLRSPDAT
ncbi:MAG: hypothetical protein ACKOZT_13100 [Cyanobium sp.]